MDYQAIEVPFNYRHTCWFCGEPSALEFCFPHAHSMLVDNAHPLISLNACHECVSFAKASSKSTIFDVRDEVKQALLSRYQKHLAIGQNWTQQELAEAEFEGGNFAGFAKSAWFVFEVAKQRLNFQGWSLVVDAQELHIDDISQAFTFDGVRYPDVHHAISFFAKTFALEQAFLTQIVHILGRQRFAQAVRIARGCVDHTPAERQRLLRQLNADITE
ncbi:hypothetical protein QWY77_10900 [Thalassotalea ponticola]|uniref:hypothetical protein n=1 Tax=Thalassotalea ponticola TaxID=1523392 RepID=UPI0025B591D9|nr:hypothetical protein [Thalassotalea ponticola]MDN3653251.1 hypothetical protein [Thalassotalea ponticola]